MRRVGAIDCGTNSIRLLVADVDAAAGTLVDHERRMEVVRLGQGIDRTGVLAPQALARTLAATADYARSCERWGVERVRFVATSATRDASNRDELVRGVQALLGVEPEVVAGAQEAQLSFTGATRELVADGQIGPFLVCDLGGGSTELVRGTSEVEAALSVDIESVRLTERHLADDPPSGDQLTAARTDVEAALDRVAAVVPLTGVGSLVGVAGTITTVAAAVLGLPAYDSARIHRARLPVEAVREACDRLVAMRREERAALPYLHPGRVDVIAAGALIWEAVVNRLVEQSGLREVVVSEHDILDGIAFSLG